MTEIRSKGKKYFLTCIYRFPSQSHNKFENFCVNFDLLLNNINDEFPIRSIVTGDFNARSSSWWIHYITDTPGQEIDSLTSSAEYAQIVDKPTHVVNNYMSCKNITSNHEVNVTI